MYIHWSDLNLFFSLLHFTGPTVLSDDYDAEHRGRLLPPTGLPVLPAGRQH